MKHFSILYTKRVHWGQPMRFTQTVKADSAEAAGIQFLNSRKGKGATVKAIDELDR